MQVPNGTEPGARRSERPVSVLHPSQIFYGNLLQFGKKSSFHGLVKDPVDEGVIAYGQAPECHLTFVKGELQMV